MAPEYLTYSSKLIRKLALIKSLLPFSQKISKKKSEHSCICKPDYMCINKLVSMRSKYTF